MCARRQAERRDVASRSYGNGGGQLRARTDGLRPSIHRRSPSEGAKTLRNFFHMVTDWHRWLGTEEESRDIGRAITGACNTAFVVMVVTGVYLWWPRRWTRQVLQAVMVPNLRLRGKPRDWNWHNTAGFGPRLS